MNPALPREALVTVPEEIRKLPQFMPTGNEFVALPEVTGDGRILSLNVLHWQSRGLLELRGPQAQPFLRPLLVWGGAEADLGESSRQATVKSRRILDWLPEFTWTCWGEDPAGEASQAPGAQAPGKEAPRSGSAPLWQLTARLAAPPGEKGFCYVLHLTARRPAAVQLGVQISWGYTGLRIFTGRPLQVSRTCRPDAWTRSVVAEALAPLPLCAWAVNASADPDLADVHPAGECVRLAKSFRLAAGGEATLAFYLAVNAEADGARTTSMHLRRRGWDDLWAETTSWLEKRRVRLAPDSAGRSSSPGTAQAAGSPSLPPGRRGRAGRTPGVEVSPQLLAKAESAINRNLLFSLFFSAGRCLDQDRWVSLTSRSPQYYVSGAFWSRDALLWSFPALLLADPGLARSVLLYALQCPSRHPGQHAQYVDGGVLYPGFELDELAAYLVALGRYLAATGDWGFLAEPAVAPSLAGILACAESWRREAGDGQGALYATFLDPSDDPVDQPFLTYSNALLCCGWRSLAWALENAGRAGQGRWTCCAGEERRAGTADPAGGETLGSETPGNQTQDYTLPPPAALRRKADQLAASIRRYCITDGPFGPMFAWSTDLQGHHRLYDNPPGSLELLGHYGFCPPEDPVFLNTRRWIHSRHNPYFFPGSFAGCGSAHAPHPWPLAAANCLLAAAAGAAPENDEAVTQALHLLLNASMDNGLACESVDPASGQAKTGAAFATAAGFMAYALCSFFRDFLPVGQKALDAPLR
ncbi:MAG: glycoside hydrolase family 125 protein [Firmicutes bacterium]|nr:glycoside hydrolase family 125 protein [Bacillota bacterium]